MADTRTNKLTAKHCENAGTGKHFDGGGLYLHVKANGKYWRYEYRIAGKHKTFAIGVYPAMSLKEARASHAVLKAQVAQGIDPMAEKKQAKQAAHVEAAASFALLAEQWFENTAETKAWGEKRREKVKRQLDKHILPTLGSADIRDITPAQIMHLVQGIDKRGKNDTAKDCLSHIRRICSRAVQLNIAPFNPAADLGDILRRKQSTPMKHVLDPDRIGEILLILERANTTLAATKAYIQLTPLLFTRPSELRLMRWDELQEADLWVKPASTMKKNRVHLVPLPTQAQAIIESMRLHTGHFAHVFTNPASGEPISDGTALRLIERNGLHEEITVHGWRHTASTLLNEQGFNKDHIEMQLSHVDKNTVRGTYNHAQYLDQRRDMLQRWADYLGDLKAQALEKERLAKISHETSN